MRARWLKPEFFTDKKVAALGPMAALVFEALWVIADDGGTAKGDAETLKSQVFYRWSAVTVPDISRALSELSGAGRIKRYAIGDDEYSIVVNFYRHQKVHKPSKFRYPKPEKGGVWLDAENTHPQSRHEVTGNGAGNLPESSGERAEPLRHSGTSAEPLPASPPPRLLDSQTPSSSSSTARTANSAAPTSDPPPSFGVVDRLQSPAHRRALVAILAAVPNPAGWEAEMGARLDGMHGPMMTPMQLGEALADYEANGNLASPNFKHFRGYLDNAAQPRESKPPASSSTRANGNGGTASTGRAAIVLQNIRELVEEVRQPGQPIRRFIRRAKVEAMGVDVLKAYEAIGGADRILNATAEQFGFVIRDFSQALEAAHAAA